MSSIKESFELTSINPLPKLDNQYQITEEYNEKNRVFTLNIKTIEKNLKLLYKLHFTQTVVLRCFLM